MRRGALQLLIAFVAAAAAVAGLIWLGRLGLDRLRGNERFQVSFEDIECTPPSGMTRQAFLDEVQYFSRVEDRLDLLDPQMREKLANAFRAHPWIKSAEIEIENEPRRVSAKLILRRPVLTVRVGEQLLTVDGEGVRLPRAAPTEGLPIFEGTAALPRGPPGTPWGDAAVEAKARSLGNGP